MMMEMNQDGHMLWMLVPVLAVVLAAAFIGFQLRPAPKAALEKFQAQGSFKTPLYRGSTPISTEPEDLLIVIPDISGYTHFMSLSKLALAHAHYVIAELLTAVLEAGDKTFHPMRLEGDAVVFHANVAAVGPREAGDGLLRIMRAFDARRQSLARENACLCKACRHIDDLDLKIIVHHGEVLRYSMGTMEDMSGEAIITAHRLLKNSVGQPRYILVTEGTGRFVELPQGLPHRTVSEAIDSTGTLSTTVYDVPNDIRTTSPGIARGTVLTAKARDLTRKLGAVV